MAVKHIIMDRAPDLVLSGVNRGANLGEDVFYSGTVAAAREAACSASRRSPSARCARATLLHWKTAEKFAPDIIRRLYAGSWPKSILMNVNFPPIPPEQVTGVKVAPQGRRLEHTQIKRIKDPAGRDMLWIGDFPTRRSAGSQHRPRRDPREHGLGDAAALRSRPTCRRCRRSAAKLSDLKPAKAARKRAAG